MGFAARVRQPKILERAGFRYVFIDEVTLLADFIEGAALFADVFASCGMKIVLSGTDSLGFVFSEDEQLYDRAEMLHTTFIPYREFERVLGLNGIDEYIQYGGTMSMGGYEYNKGRMMEEIVLLETKMERPDCRLSLKSDTEMRSSDPWRCCWGLRRFRWGWMRGWRCSDGLHR